jgi:hypothetical protein
MRSLVTFTNGYQFDLDNVESIRRERIRVRGKVKRTGYNIVIKYKDNSKLYTNMKELRESTFPFDEIEIIKENER